MRLLICNAFSLAMLDREAQKANPRFPLPVDNPQSVLADFRQHGAEILSAVGHSNTAAIFSDLLDMEVSVNRFTVQFSPDDVALIGQYIGPRLPEGATQLPEGAKIEWWTV